LGERVAVTVGDDNVGVVHEPVDRGGGKGLVHDLVKAGGVQVARHRERASFVGGVDEPVEPLGCVGGDGQQPDVVDLCGCPHRSIYADTATMPRGHL